MNPHIGPLGVASLALLAERPMHPYEMYQTLINRAEDRIVKVRPGSLYHAVDRLAAAGLVQATGTDRDGNRPERTTYEITERGQVAMAERLTDMLVTPADEYPEFPLAIAEAHNLPKETVIDLLERRLMRLRSDLAFYDEGLATVQTKNVQRKFWIDITYKRAVYEAEIAWIEGFIAELTSGSIDW